MNNHNVKLKLDKLLESEIKPSEPGGSVLLKKGKDIIYLKNFGLANLETKERITEHTVFNTGSISKTFVSNGILILKERGFLSLNDSISIYFNDFRNKEIANKVKIKHLLSHTSGLPDNRRVNENIEFYLTAKDSENFAPLKLTDSLEFHPGEKFKYSNPAYNGLALIIEKTTKEKWQKFIIENIFKPSNMDNSKITDGAYPQKGVAHAYKFKNGQYIENDYGEVPTFAASGNSGVWSSVMDLANYEKSLNEQKFLSKELLKESRTIYKPKNWKDTINPRVGYSWFITPKIKSRYKMDMIYHTGEVGGFHSFYFYFPSKDVLFVGLFNKPLEKYWDIVNKSLDICHENNWFD
ncbi:serine hydrolase domain-containing protein [Aquimarina aggregata]|uniref:serine hydrolase domain-containing protein n=1 Tax=Aquimarina aggregata TaxID=1642818 RepID=UPI00249261CB|nr:serine hydrolase domain-containing protein [Aquimarina aggregata]